MVEILTEKPSEFDFERIKNKSSGPLKQKYDQMFTLFRFLPLIIHDLIPSNDENWELDFSASIFRSD